jgi:hypothetical protein
MMAQRYPTKEYEYKRGVDWFYDRLIFDNMDDKVESVTIPMKESEYKALEAIRLMCHRELGDDYTGPMPRIEITDN